MAASVTAQPAFTDLVRIDVVSHGTAVRLVVIGEVDSSSAPVLARELDGALDGPAEEVVVDLCGVTFLDSAGLCVLAATHRRAGEQQVGMRVRAASRAVVRPLEITGLWQLLGAERVEPGAAEQPVA